MELDESPERTASRVVRSGVPSAPLTTNRLVAYATAALLGAAVVFVLGVGTRWGQSFGDSAYAGRMRSSPELRDGAREALDSVRAISTVLFGSAILAVALVRKRVRLAAVVLGVMVVSILGAELLKRGLPRPDYGIDPPGMTANWAPSGHSTVAITLVLCALMVVPASARRVVSIIGALYVAVIASATLAAGWHRPTDAVMAVFWSFSIATFGLAIDSLGRRTEGSPEPRTDDHDGSRHPVTVALAMLLPIAVLVGSFIAASDPIVWTESSGRFVMASIVIDLVAAGSVLVFAALDRQSRSSRARSDRTTQPANL